MAGIIAIILWISTIVGFVFWNLWQRITKLEDIANKQAQHIAETKSAVNNITYAFDKLDGSNIRAEWNPKRGWYKFGTRNTMIDERDLQFGEAITLFKNKYGDSLPKVFRDNKSYKRIESFVVFAEYVGENSFAGRHLDEDKKDIILFDVIKYFNKTI